MKCNTGLKQINMEVLLTCWQNCKLIPTPPASTSPRHHERLFLNLDRYFKLTQRAFTIYLFSKRNTRAMCEMCSRLTMKTPERHHQRSSKVFIVYFEQISHMVLVFPLYTLRKYVTVDKDKVTSKIRYLSAMNFFLTPEPLEIFSESLSQYTSFLLE